MRRFAANYIFPVNEPPIRNGIVETTDDGEIIKIIRQEDNFSEIHSTQFFNGVVVPGFINAHCHLELSHLKGLKPDKPGIAGFIEAVTTFRNDVSTNVDESIKKALTEASNTGTVAIGDICNTTATLKFKKASGIQFYNFVELFGINPNAASNTFDNGIKAYEDFKRHYPNSTSLTPHSTYSISEELWTLIANHIHSFPNEPVSIHYGESKAEYQFLWSGDGPLYDRYSKASIPFVPPKGLTPCEVIKKNIPAFRKLMLIHNTFASTREIELLKTVYPDISLVTCPESNLLIEKNLPSLELLTMPGVNVCIGTDSLASSSSLSLLNHVMLILENYPSLSFDIVIKWATLNGAQALDMDKYLGTIEPGKKPGLLLITPFDFTKMRPTADSRIIRLI